MSELKLVQPGAAAPHAMPAFTEAERGDVEALGSLLASAVRQCGFGYEAQRANVAATAMEAETIPADKLAWRHLAAVEREQGCDAALSAWEDVKQSAREELASGHRAAMVMEGSDAMPIDRARFLVLRELFASEWKPVNGIEFSLVDQMTQAATAQSYWTERLTMRTMQEAAEDLRYRQELSKDEQMYRFGEWLPPRLSTSEAMQEAMGMVDRWNRVFLRCLRQLRDLRRFNVVIQNAGQVNVGQQQVNVGQPQVNLNKQEARPVKRAKAKRRSQCSTPSSISAAD